MKKRKVGIERERVCVCVCMRERESGYNIMITSTHTSWISTVCVPVLYFIDSLTTPSVAFGLLLRDAERDSIEIVPSIPNLRERERVRERERELERERERERERQRERERDRERDRECVCA